jgi:orotidine-5'-phosphate decarboxylase
MESFLDKLRDQWVKKNTALCFGMDPVVERMNIDTSKNLADEIEGYFSRILFAVEDRISAVKPNVAFYLQYGEHGMKALQKLVQTAKSVGLPVIIDAKIGDIGRTSGAYARYVFEVLEGDAVTLNPYLGYDSLQPFFSYDSKGFYILALTSNEGAAFLQFEEMKNGGALYEKIIRAVCGWNKSVAAAGVVVGATHEEFKHCIEIINSASCRIPLLIPGVGAQGGSYGAVMHAVGETGYDSGIIRVNASSSISYAHEKYPSLSFEEASVQAVNEMIDM